MDYQLKPIESKFEGRIIDLRRFAYDVLVISARKVRVPNKSIPQRRGYEGPKNNYGHSDFLSVVFRYVFRVQMQTRFDLNILFEEYAKNNSLDKVTNMAKLWDECYDKKKYPKSQFEENLRLSLALANELLLFFDSKKFDFYQSALGLSIIWRYWICDRKSEFEKLGGIGYLYITGKMSAYRMDDSFNDKYIPIKCIPYEESSKNPNLLAEIAKLFQNHREVTENYERARGVVKRYSPPEWTFIDNIYDIPEQDTASGIDIPLNTGLGIIPHEELVQQYGMEASPSQNQTEVCPQEPSRHLRRLYRRQKRLQCPYCRYRVMVQTFSQLGVEYIAAKQSSDEKPSISETDHGTPSKKESGEIPKDSELHHVESTGEQKNQKSKCSSLQNLEQDISGISLNTLTERQSVEDKPNIDGTHHAIPSANQTEVIPYDLERPQIGSTGEKKTQKSKCSSLQNLEQDISQFILHTLTERQSVEDKPNIDGTYPAIPSANQTEVIPYDTEKTQIRSTGEQKTQKNKCSSFESLLRMILDSSAKQSCKKKLSISDTLQAIPSQNQIGTISKDPARPRVESTDKQKIQNGKCSSLQKVEQDIKQLIYTLWLRNKQQKTSLVSQKPIMRNTIQTN